MRINSVKLHNFKQFPELDLSLGPQLNLIAGINGAGKTSLLEGIAWGLENLVWNYSSKAGLPFRSREQSFVRTILMESQERRRLEPQYPTSSILEIEDENKKYEIGATIINDRSENSNRNLSLSTFSRPKDFGRTLPIFAYYIATRFIKNNWNSGENTPSLTPEERLTAYRNWCDFDSIESSRDDLTWIITKTTERMQKALRSHQTFGSIQNDELYVLKKALNDSFPEIDDIYYDWEAKAILITIKTKITDNNFEIVQIPFESLSDGQRSVILLFVDIVRRMCLLNPHLAEKAALQTDGIILVDELDAHLHPDWQRKIVRGLRKSFPLIQFVVTSHSPTIIGEVDRHSLYLLSNGELKRPEQSFGLDVYEIIEKVMNASGQSDEITNEIDAIKEISDRGEGDEARKRLDALETRLNGSTRATRDLDAVISLAELYEAEE